MAKLKTKISVEDYLAGEEVSQIKYEYVYGEVYAMAGTSDNHNRIVINLTTALSVHLRNSKCEPFSGDIKVVSVRTFTITRTFWFRVKKIPKIRIFVTNRF